LELVYQRSRFVGQLFIYGDSFTPFLIAIVRPEEVYTQKWASENKLTTDIKELCQKAELRTAIMNDFALIATESKLQGFEKVMGVIVTNTEWTPGKFYYRHF
jgi:long-chain acyl-CoA synthetase